MNDLAVRRPWLRRVFGELHHRGIRKVALAVDSQSLTGATRLYERAGMRIERLYSVYRKELRPGEQPTEPV